MKFLITESQLDSTIQTMINQTLIEFNKHCDYSDANNWPDWLSFDDCNTMETIEKIKVVSTEKVKLDPKLHKFPFIRVLVNIEFSSIFASDDFSDFLYSLRSRIQQKYKITIQFSEGELINTNTNRNW